MRLLLYSVVLILLCSCATLKLADNKKDVTQINLDYQLKSNINPIFIPYIDSIFDVTIDRFNNEGRSFTVKRKGEGDEEGLTVIVERAKYIRKSGVTAGYIISGVGLVAAPTFALSASGGQWFLLFYYFPADRIELSSSLAPSLSAKPGKKVKTVVTSGVLFTKKSKRLTKMSYKLDESLYELLVNLDKNAKSR